MKQMRMLAVTAATFAMAGFSSVAGADSAAGKAKFTAVCAECHEVADFEGEAASGLADTMKKMVAGQQKHKNGMKLTEAEIADLAAYLSAGK
jgi:mono/diheme cytochrome c family protein